MSISAPSIDRPTRGLRNRNPGNLRDYGIAWQGRVGHDALGFVVFDTDFNGIRALTIDLHTDFCRLVRPSIAAIMRPYAPPSENDTVGYIAFVASRLGISPDDMIPAFTPPTALALDQAIIRMECGGQPYSEDLIAAAVAAAFDHFSKKGAG